MNNEATFRSMSFRLILVFLALSMGICLVGYFFYQKERSHIRTVGEESLSAIADLKVKQIGDWKDERMRDAGFIFNDVHIANHVANLRKNPSDSSATESMLSWMSAMYKNRQYAAMFVVNTQGRILLALPRERAVHAYQQAVLPLAIRSKKITFSDFFIGEDRNIYLDIIVPVLLGITREKESVGAVVLRIDPHGSLYPIIQSWSTPSRTAESLLVRRDGEEVVFLNELRHKKNTTLSLRFSANQKDLPAAMATRGRTGVIEGTDYRGVPVLAALKPVPDSPWFLVAKVDIEEIYAPNRVLFRLIGLFTGLLIVSAGLSLMLFWRRQQAQSEASLRESEERYRTVADFTYDWEYWISPDKRILYTSPSCERITGYSAGEFVENPRLLEEIVHPDDRKILTAHMDSVDSESENDVHKADFRIIRRDGGIRWIGHVCRTIRRPDGTSLGRRASNRDITERKHSEAALRESEERYRRMLDIMLEGCQIIGFDWRYLYINDTASKHNRRPKEELLGRTVMESWPGIIETDIFALEKSCMEGRTVKQLETEFTFPGGHNGWFRLVIQPVPEGIAVYSEDITEPKRAEAALRQSEEQFRVMFETASIGMAQADVHTGRWLGVNQKMCEITGYSSEEMLRLRIPEITHPEDRERDWEAFQSVVKGESQNYHLEKRYVRKDGEVVWVNVNMTVIRNAEGEPLHTMAAIEDISERKRSEMEREATVEFLQLVNRDLGFDDLVREAAAYFQRRSGCEAVGIRLKKGGDYPYYESRGFPEDFVRTESSLCSKDGAGDILRDEWDNPVLACMCGNIICGRFDPSKPFFSPGGSFWSNSTTKLLATTTEADRKSRTRNRCNGEGYESVALVPLRVGEERLGLIQLNDRRKDMFSPEIIALWERLAGHLAVALAKVGAEEALKESESHYHSLFENMLNGFAYCRMIYEAGRPSDFIYLDVNPAFERLTGLKGVVGKKVSEVIPGIREADPGLFEVYGRVAETGLPETAEIHVEALGMWFSISVYSTRREYFVAVFDVITERKLAEEALLRSEEKYRTLVENVNIGIYRRIAGHRGRFLQVNDAMALIFGYASADEFVKVSPYEIYEKMEDWERFEEKIYERGYLRGENVRLKRKDGSSVWCSITAKIHYDKDSGAEYIDGVMEDITERRNLEAQLVQAQKMEAIGQLAGGVAHDFNNILTAMMGYGHILKVKLKGDDSLRIYADRILSLADRASSLTQSLLAFSRKQVMNPRPVNLNEVIKTVERLLFRIIGEDVRLQTLLSEKELTVMADHVQLEQVLMNLATNARDAMPQGGFLTIGTEALKIDREFIKEHGFGKEGEYALVSVTDSGVGMDRDIREKIFEPFFTTKDVGKGTGLGLSMAYGIIRQHEGHINVYSEPGKGTTFRVYLPLIRAKVEEIKPEIIAPVESGTETILLAEDESEVREFTKRLLEEYGYKVIEARDGEDALEKFRKYKDEIGMLLMDVIMPGKSGGEAYEEIRKINPEIKVLFLSGYPGDAIQRQGILNEDFTLIMKPVAPSLLLKKVRDVLDR